MKTCSVEGCGRPARPSRLCSMHESRRRRHGSVHVTKYHHKGATDKGPFCTLFRKKKSRRGQKDSFYWFTRLEGHGEIAVHILVAEYYMGRRLKNGEVVHHLDGDGLNNREINLFVMKADEHSALHARELEAPF